MAGDLAPRSAPRQEQTLDDGRSLYSRDPLFIPLTVVVGLGMILTGTSYLLDRRHLTR